MAFVVGVYARTQAASLRQEEWAALRRSLQIGPMDEAGFAGSARLQLA